MGNIIVINNNEISEVLKDFSRQYLVGNLKRPQPLKYYKSSYLEVGITEYKEYSIEKTHKHTNAIEFQYVLNGYTEYIDNDTAEIYRFKKGDFYVIEKETSYAQKSKKGTSILFIKIPSINDKTLVEDHDFTIKFLSETIKSVRKDYYYDSDAPKANSVRPAASIVLIQDDKILMLKRSDNLCWSLPGGTLEHNENLTTCLIREVKEECNLDIEIMDIIGTYTDPNIIVEYMDGEVRREFTIVFYGKIVGGDVKIDEESLEFDFIPIDKVLSLNMTPSQKRRIEDVISYLNNKTRVFR